MDVPPSILANEDRGDVQVKSSASTVGVGSCQGTTHNATHIYTYPNRWRSLQMMSVVLCVKGADDFVATTSDDGGFIYTKEVWAEAYLLGCRMVEN